MKTLDEILPAYSIIPAEGVGPARSAASVSNPYVCLFCSALAHLGTDDVVPSKIAHYSRSLRWLQVNACRVGEVLWPVSTGMRTK